MSDVHERLRRLLFLVPYVARHPGITVDALAEAAGTRREELLKELDLLAFVGRPPFQPDDYIDIYVENDRVFVDLDQRLSAPPRLTAAEAAALSAAAELLRPAAGDALSAARAKLERALPPGAVERFREMNRQINAHAVAPEGLGPLTSAIGLHREVEFDYFSAGRGSSERRTVRPRELFAHRGQWYLSAWCCTRQDDRLFRLDRVQNVTPTERSFTPDSREGRTLPNPVGAQGSVRVVFSPLAAPYVRERFGVEARSTGEGGVEVQVAAGPEAERWLTTWVLSFGGEAWITEPEWARSAVARAASGSLKSGVTR